KMAIMAGPLWAQDQEIAASVRVDSWVNGEYSRAGVSVRTNPTTGLGYRLVFSGPNQVRFLSGTTNWGNSFSFTWQTGVWYRFRLRAERDILLGKVWRADLSEPTNWMFRQDGWNDYPTGCPALFGGSAWSGQGSATVSFDDAAATNI